MAVDKQTIVENYPLPVYSYKVVIDDSEEFSFSEVAGLEIDYDHLLYRHGYSWATGDYLIRTQRKPINITLRRGVAKSRRFLYDWLKSADKKNLSIDLCDENGDAIVSWSVYRALPFKLDAPSFNANSNDVAIEGLDLIAHDLTLTHHQ